jgi:hypothetical protein
VTIESDQQESIFQEGENSEGEMWLDIHILTLLTAFDTIVTCSTSQKFGHTYSFQDFSLFVLFFKLYNNIEDIKTMT